MAGGVSLSDKTREALAKFASGWHGQGRQPARLGDAALSHLARSSRADDRREARRRPRGRAGAAGAGRATSPGRRSIADERGRARLRADGRARRSAGSTSGRPWSSPADRADRSRGHRRHRCAAARVARAARRGARRRRQRPLVLAKARSREQPQFVDLPAIGPDTVANAAEGRDRGHRGRGGRERSCIDRAALVDGGRGGWRSASSASPSRWLSRCASSSLPASRRATALGADLVRRLRGETSVAAHRRRRCRARRRRG